MQQLSQLLACAVQPGSHRIVRDPACGCDFAIAQAGNLAQQKDIPIEQRQMLKRLLHCDGRFLRRWSRCILQIDGVRSAPNVTPVVERQVPRDAEHPGALAVRCRRGNRASGHAKEDLLGQVRRIPVADDPAEVAEDPVSVRGKENMGSRQQVGLQSLMTPLGADPLTATSQQNAPSLSMARSSARVSVGFVVWVDGACGALCRPTLSRRSKVRALRGSQGDTSHHEHGLSAQSIRSQQQGRTMGAHLDRRTRMRN
jgi:hypothetical protein